MDVRFFGLLLPKSTNNKRRDLQTGTFFDTSPYCVTVCIAIRLVVGKLRQISGQVIYHPCTIRISHDVGDGFHSVTAIKIMLLVKIIIDGIEKTENISCIISPRGPWPPNFQLPGAAPPKKSWISKKLFKRWLSEESFICIPKEPNPTQGRVWTPNLLLIQCVANMDLHNPINSKD
jgi:hypothetical protein